MPNNQPNQDSKKSLKEIMDKLAKEHPVDPKKVKHLAHLYYMLGCAYSTVEKIDRAMECFEKADELDSGSASTLWFLGVTYYKKGNFDKAVEVLKKAIECNPEWILPYIDLVGVYKKEGMQEEAEKYRAKIDVMKRKQAEADIKKCKEELRKEENEESRGERVGREKPTDPEKAKKLASLYSVLGNSYERIEKIEKAIECLEKAVELDSENPRMVNSLGMAYKRKKEYDKAIELLSKAIKLDPENVRIYAGLSFAYRSKGMKEEAKKYWEKRNNMMKEQAEAEIKKYEGEIRQEEDGEENAK